MGRYYDGDISGKFWFGIQSSNAADRFGVTGEVDEDMEELYGGDCPLGYSFDEENLSSVTNEIKKIENNLGVTKELLDNFFKENSTYDSDDIEELFNKNNIEFTDVDFILSDYADLRLGYQIKECLEKNGYCSFEADI